MTGPVPSPESSGHPLVGRQRRLVRALEVGLILAGGVAIGAVVLPGAAGKEAARTFVAILIATPLLRVAWLTLRWLNRRDFPFALVGAGVLAVALGAVAAAW